MHEATGLSIFYAAQIWRGNKTPHRRHWKGLNQLADEHWDEAEEQRRLEERYAGIDFDRDIRPALEQLKVSEIAAKVGLSRSYVSQIQSGRRTPSLE